VAAVHAQGILHRDLKPENVILRPDGEPVLLDFGLARELDAQKLTRTGQLVGTPAYMSPEQADGLPARELDVRVDVYGLGVILFTLLSGRCPFEASGLPALLKQLLVDDPDWPPAPGPLLAILQRAMAKDREDRYPEATALREDLERYLSGEAVESAATARLPVLLAGVAAALLAGLGLALVLGWGTTAGPAELAGPAEPAAVGDPVSSPAVSTDPESVEPSGPDARVGLSAVESTALARRIDGRGEGLALVRDWRAGWLEIQRAPSSPAASLLREAMWANLGLPLLTLTPLDETSAQHSLGVFLDDHHLLLGHPDSPRLASCDLRGQVLELKEWATLPAAGLQTLFASVEGGRPVVLAGFGSGPWDGAVLRVFEDRGHRTLSDVPGARGALCATRDGSVFAFGAGESLAVIRRTPVGQPVETSHETGTPTLLAISPDGARLLVAEEVDDRSSRVTLWGGSQDLERLRSVELAGVLVDLEFSRDGQRCALATSLGAIQVWAASDGELVCDLVDPAGGPLPAHYLVGGVAFSLDGLGLYSVARSASDDARSGGSPGSLRVWTSQGDFVGQAGFTGTARSLDLSPDGSLLLVETEEGVVHLLGAPPPGER
jgi:WD40 repeat protein